MGLFLRTFFEDLEIAKKPVNMDSLFRAAHDLRSPLSALNMTVHHFKKLSPHLDHLDFLDETVRRINSIADEILQARKKTGTRVEGFDPLKALQKFAQEAQFQLRDSVELLGFHSPPQHPYMAQGNAEDFTRILWNLIQNAVDAGASCLQFSMIEKSSMFVLKIRDNGYGIPADILAKIGQEGFTTKAQGNGLGLYTSIKKLRAWEGNLVVHSTQHRGSTLQISLKLL